MSQYHQGGLCQSLCEVCLEMTIEVYVAKPQYKKSHPNAKTPNT